MMYADTALGRVEASPGLQGTCPACGHPCRPKCGKINVHHWAHHARADCDPWAEPMTEWHLGWQLAVPPERREVVMGPHRADIVTASGGVVEIQHSSISADAITAREEFYGERMAWIFDATQAHITVSPMPLGSPRGLSAEVHFKWTNCRRSVAACRRPVFLDLGNGRVLHSPERFVSDGAGLLYTRASVEGWLRGDNAKLERIVLPPRRSWKLDDSPKPNLGPVNAAARIIAEMQAERDRQRGS